jgi:hypothetical protein
LIGAGIYVNINVLGIAKVEVENILAPYLPTNHPLEY